MNVKVNYMLISHGRFKYIEIKNYENVRSVSCIKNVLTVDYRLGVVNLKRDNIVELKIYE